VKYHRVEHLSKETDEQRASRFGFRRLANAEGESVWVHSTEDFNISNPYLSECGRFEVRPSYYGLSDEAARSVRAEPPGGLQ
jgi:hypothetical protein